METKTISFARKGTDPSIQTLSFLSVSAPRITMGSNYADLRDVDDKVLASITWQSSVDVKVTGAEVQTRGR
jgi:hypothetical protein